MKLRENIKRRLNEFQFDELKRAPFRDGELVLEMVTSDRNPKYVIFYESGDFEEGNTDGEIIAEMDADFFDGHMAQTVMEYLITRE
jgi:hypothetical protein|tara:strand:- start:1813 stop:2070 length:258 start_codon:yes stop_codon:yes gene_type:complete